MSVHALKISGEARQQMRDACRAIEGELDRIEGVPVELKAGDVQFDQTVNAAFIAIARHVLSG